MSALISFYHEKNERPTVGTDALTATVSAQNDTENMAFTFPTIGLTNGHYFLHIIKGEK